MTRLPLQSLLAAAVLWGAGDAAHARDRSDASKDTAASQTPSGQISAEPQQTSATFGDWVVRCVSGTAPAKRSCEAAQSLVVKGQQAPIAQIAFSLLERQETVTVLLPVNIAFDKPPQIGPDESRMTTLDYRRCIPAGCLASAKVDADAVNGLKTATKQGRLVFTDATERTIALPVSPRGLAQALNDLTKEK